MYVTLVPLTAEILMLKTPYYSGNNEDVDGLYREVVEK